VAVLKSAAVSLLLILFFRALTGVYEIAAFSVYPPLGIAMGLVLFLSVAPYVALYREKGALHSIVSAGICVSLVGVIIGWKFALFYTLAYVLYSFSYVLFSKSRVSFFWKMTAAGAAWTVLFSAVILMYEKWFGVNMFNYIINYLSEAGAYVTERNYSLPQFTIEMTEKMEGFFIEGIEAFRRNFMAWVFVYALSGSFGVYYAVNKFSKNKQPQEIEGFKMPESFIWLLIAVGIIYILRSYNLSHALLINTSENMGIMLLSGYFFNGLALLSSLMSHLNFSLFLKLFTIAILLSTPGLYLLITAGIADVWIDFRVRGKGKRSKP